MRRLPVLLARDTLRIASASIAAPPKPFRSHRIPPVYIAGASDRPSLRKVHAKKSTSAGLVPLHIATSEVCASTKLVTSSCTAALITTSRVLEHSVVTGQLHVPCTVRVTQSFMLHSSWYREINTASPLSWPPPTVAATAAELLS